MSKKGMLEKLKQGGIIEVLFIDYDGNIAKNRFIKVFKEYYNIESNNRMKGYIFIDDVDDDLNILNYDYKTCYITKMIEPVEYSEWYENDKILTMSKDDIEKALGYKIEIVEE